MPWKKMENDVYVAFCLVWHPIYYREQDTPSLSLVSIINFILVADYNVLVCMT